MSDTFLTVVTNFRRRWRRLSLQLGFESFVGVLCLLKVIYREYGPMCIEEFIFKEGMMGGIEVPFQRHHSVGDAW